MPKCNIVDLLTRDDFLRELHHLLWIEPAERRGKWDPGWNCRDHAFIVGFIARLLRSEAVVILGRAMFIVGPSGEKVPLGVEQSPHAWLAINGYGYFDLSLRFSSGICSFLLDEAFAVWCVPVLQFSADNYASRDFR
jgi:hypothetical protein